MPKMRGKKHRRRKKKTQEMDVKSKIIPLKTISSNERDFLRFFAFIHCSNQIFTPSEYDKDVSRIEMNCVIDQFKRETERGKNGRMKSNPFDEFSADVTLNQLLINEKKERIEFECTKTKPELNGGWIELNGWKSMCLDRLWLN